MKDVTVVDGDDGSIAQQTEASGSPLLLAMVIVSHAMNHLQMGALPVLFPELLDEFNLSYVDLGLLRSASSFASGFPQMFVGLLRRWIPGRILLGAGNLISSSMNVLASLARSFQLFLAFRIVGGVGGSPQHPVGTSLVTTNVDPASRGRILGLNLALPSLTSTLAPIIAVTLMIPLEWRMTIRIIAMPAFVSACIMLVFVKERRESAVGPEDAPSFGGFLEALRNRNVLAVSSVRMVMAFRMGVRVFIPLYFIEVLGLSTGLSSILYSLMISGSVVGPFFWGYLSDRMRRKPLVVGILACSSLLFLGLNRVRLILLLAPILFLIGFMVQTVVVQNILADSTERAQLDQIFGFYYTVGFTLGSLSSLVFGYIVELFGFGHGFNYIAAVTAISIIPAMFIAEHGAPIQQE